MDARGVTTGAMAFRVLLLVVAGGPLVAWIWATLNDLLAGHFHAMQVVIAIPAAILLWLLLRYMARLIERWGEQRYHHT